MFKLPFKLKAQKPQTPTSAFLIDIGTTSIKAAAIEFSEGKTILNATGKALIDNSISRGGVIFDKEKFEASLDTLLSDISKMLETVPEHVVVGLSGNAYISSMTTVRVNRHEPEKNITTKELAEVSEKITNTAQTDAEEQALNMTGNAEIGLSLITTAKITELLNGIPESELEGKKGTKIERIQYSAFTYDYHLETLKEVFSKLELQIYAITPNMYTVVETLKRCKQNPHLDAIIIDVGGDITEIAVVFNGGIVATKTLNLGGNQFTYMLTKETGLTVSEAERLKLAYSYGKLSEMDEAKIEGLIEDAARIWSDGLEIAFSDFDGVKTFPTNLFLAGGGSSLPLITEVVRTYPWKKKVPFKNEITEGTIKQSEMDWVLDKTGKMNSAEMVNLLALNYVLLGDR